MILDTTFIIDLMEELPQAVAKMEQLHQRQENIIITTPTLFELWTGVAYGNQPEKEKQKIRLILENQSIFDLTSESAQQAGLINGTLQKQGQMIDPEDCLIAGIALHHNQALLTRNTKHFQRIKGLKLETY